MGALTAVIRAWRADVTTVQLAGGDFTGVLSKIATGKLEMLVFNNCCN